MMVVGNVFTLVPSSFSSYKSDKYLMLSGSSHKLQQSFKCSTCGDVKPSNNTCSFCFSIPTLQLQILSSYRYVRKYNSFGRLPHLKPWTSSDFSFVIRPVEVSNISILVLLKSKLVIEPDDTENSLRLVQPFTLIFFRDFKCFSLLTLQLFAAIQCQSFKCVERDIYGWI